MLPDPENCIQLLLIFMYSKYDFDFFIRWLMICNFVLACFLIGELRVIRMQSGPATPILFSVVGLLLAITAIYGQAQMSRHGVKIAMPYQFEDTEHVIQVAALD